MGVKTTWQPLPPDRLGQWNAGKNAIDLATHDTSTFFHELAHAAHTRIDGPNDLVIDAKGGMYITDPQFLPGVDKVQAGKQVYYRKPNGELITKRLSSEAYLQIVAASNYKQRVRKMHEYFHADRLNYLDIGTPNLLEYDQGFFDHCKLDLAEHFRKPLKATGEIPQFIH